MSLIVFPAIDLKGGQVVRLAQGDMDRATVYGSDPAAQATKFAEQGADHLHVVDLDGAFAGEAVNPSAVQAIIEAFPGKVQLGGGIVIGTAALQNPDLVREAARDLPGKIVVGVDARDGYVATHGWAEVSDMKVEELANRFADAGVAALLFTDVGRDGLLKGCNVDATLRLARRTRMPVIASGGVRDLGDILELARSASEGIEGVITGRALYDGTLKLEAALGIARA
jgi:phosphoribosylformimino-5-aminoimidazole carboxamide ribotide isomerase